MGLLLLQDIVDNKKLQMRGIIGLYAANTVGDDIEIYKDDSRTEVLCRCAYELLDSTLHSTACNAVDASIAHMPHVTCSFLPAYKAQLAEYKLPGKR